jgi:hypothetical protein
MAGNKLHRCDDPLLPNASSTAWAVWRRNDGRLSGWCGGNDDVHYRGHASVCRWVDSVDRCRRLFFRRNQGAEEPPIAPQDAAASKFDSIGAVAADRHDDAHMNPKLGIRVLDSYLRADPKW